MKPKSPTNRRPLARTEATRVIATPLPNRASARLTAAEKHCVRNHALAIATALVGIALYAMSYIVVFNH